jgi:hypothetical protein
MGKEWFEPVPEGARLSVNDWRWMADWFNHVGGLCQKNDVQFVYRVSDFEGFEEMWTRTEPTRVKFEIATRFQPQYAARTVLAQVQSPAAWPFPEPNQIRHCYLAK